MRIFPRPIQIGDTDGFVTSKDIFGRRDLGIGLTNLVGSVADPMVIAIDGQWGTGKTTFLKMWAGHLRQSGFPVVYFDSFENDYMDDAFAALASQIVGLIDAEKKADEPRAKAFLHKALGAGKVIARSALKVGVKVATAGALAATDFEDLAEAVSSEAEELADKHIGELLTKQAERRGILQAFRDALRDLPEILGNSDVVARDKEFGRNGESKPLIFIIDELDRCRPVFALQILERIKHFFVVSNVHFVLGVHMGQLRASVRMAYGGDVDATTYLQKFINLTFPLVDHVGDRRDHATWKYIDYLAGELEIAPDDTNFLEASVSFVKTYAILKKISLRDVDHIMSNIALAVAFTGRRTLRPDPLIAGLSILRVARPDLYMKAKRGDLSYEEAEDALGLARESGEGNDEDRGYSRWQRGWWQFALKREVENDLLQAYRSKLFDYSLGSRFSIIPLICHKVIDKLTGAGE